MSTPQEYMINNAMTSHVHCQIVFLFIMIVS